MRPAGVKLTHTYSPRREAENLKVYLGFQRLARYNSGYHGYMDLDGAILTASYIAKAIICPSGKNSELWQNTTAAEALRALADILEAEEVTENEQR